jgi:hypothetical protein
MIFAASKPVRPRNLTVSSVRILVSCVFKSNQTEEPIKRVSMIENHSSAHMNGLKSLLLGKKR